MFSQKVAVPPIRISNIISKYLWHFVVLRTQLPYQTCMSVSQLYTLGTPDIFRKGGILSSSCCHAILRPFDFFNRRMFVRQNVWVSCRNFGGISFMHSRNIAVFRNIVYIFVTRGHVISTLARMFRQISRVRSKSGISENYLGKSRTFCLLKWCMV